VSGLAKAHASNEWVAAQCGRLGPPSCNPGCAMPHPCAATPAGYYYPFEWGPLYSGAAALHLPDSRAPIGGGLIETVGMNSWAPAGGGVVSPQGDKVSRPPALYPCPAGHARSGRQPPPPSLRRAWNACVALASLPACTASWAALVGGLLVWPIGQPGAPVPSSPCAQPAAAWLQEQPTTGSTTIQGPPA
jgi:hypothetical protein